MRGVVRRKHSFLLLEVTVSFTLLGLLLATLGFWHTRMFCTQKKNEKIYAIFLQENRAYFQLRNLFSSVYDLPKENTTSLCSVMFDRGVYRDPDLAGVVRGDVVYNFSDRKLELHIQSLRNSHKRERLILLNHVSHVDFSSLGDENRANREIYVTICREVPGHSARTLSYQFPLEM
ncbi:hypothetical protein CP10139811_0665 [Chlamydia ibidis]|uniref:Prepilin-type N-terminal cleavage/methylation domain protein n=2 Tax=Chlamydia ibidis TaxID=1405396 RepID=S7J3V4_9CHLA|nr:DUF1494 domain-containing protein [Chlamydia ibidis]EPP34903.1 hypothetical protein CP10139811_0665 [Chlamydia ibidis]EQM62276.1 hypothetical protein H359_1050 [Chlamydia ibidis 10-1398/6]